MYARLPLVCIRRANDGTQVVGRVHKGLEILEKVNESAVDPDDLPLQRIVITSCGLTDAQVYVTNPARVYTEIK